LLCVLECDTRPPDYAGRFATAARRLVLLDDGGERPPWWAAVRQTPAAQSIAGDLRAAFRRLAEGV
jgi:hypothetical protein